MVNYLVYKVCFFIAWDTFGLLCILLMMIHLCFNRRGMFQSKKNPNSISRNKKNQNLVLRSLIFMLICDLIYTISMIIHSITENLPYIFPIFKEVNDDLNSVYWHYIRFNRILAIFSFSAYMSSSCWAVCFAISLLLLLKSGGKDILYIYLYDIFFHLISTVGSIIIFIIWTIYRNITQLFLFKKFEKIDDIIVATFYLFALLLNLVLIFIHISIYLLIIGMLLKNFKLFKMSFRNSFKFSELKILLKMSLFMIPFIILGFTNIVAYFILILEGYFKINISSLEEYSVDIQELIISSRGIMNVIVYGINVGRFDNLLYNCCTCILSPILKKKKIDKNSTNYYTKFEDQSISQDLNDDVYKKNTNDSYSFNLKLPTVDNSFTDDNLKEDSIIESSS